MWSKRICMLLIVVATTLAATATAKSSTKLELLEKAQKKYSRPYVTLTNSNYTKFLEDGPREYATVLMLTVENPKYNCQACLEADVIFNSLAQSYLRWFKSNPTDANAATRIVFMKADYEFTTKLYEAHGLTTAPILTYLDPTTKKGKKGPKLEIETDFSSFSSIDTLKGHVKKRTGVDFPVVPEPSSRQTFVFGLVLLVSVLFGLFANGSLHSFIALPRRKGFWMFICLGVYTFAVSGTVFCIIRGTPFAKRGQDGSINFFEGQDRTQTYGEGLTIGMLNGLFALSVIAATRTKWSTARLRSKSRYASLLVNAIGLLVCLGAASYAALRIVELHHSKVHWYSFDRVASHVFQESPASVVQNMIRTIRKSVGPSVFKTGQQLGAQLGNAIRSNLPF